MAHFWTKVKFVIIVFFSEQILTDDAVSKQKKIQANLQMPRTRQNCLYVADGREIMSGSQQQLIC